jgi:hypothetical protein
MLLEETRYRALFLAMFMLMLMIVVKYSCLRAKSAYLVGHLPPTRRAKGVYRWIDPTVPPATLPREDCDFLREIRYKDGALAEKGKAAASTTPRAFERDQSKFFHDAPHGDRHARLRAVGVAIRCETRAGAAEIADAMAGGPLL